MLKVPFCRNTFFNKEFNCILYQYRVKLLQIANNKFMQPFYEFIYQKSQKLWRSFDCYLSNFMVKIKGYFKISSLFLSIYLPIFPEVNHDYS